MSKLIEFHIISCKYYDPEGLETEYISKLAKGVKGKKVLDVGCGIGRLTRTLSKAGAKVTGIDTNKESIRYCFKNIRFKNARFLVADAEKTPLNETFDIILYPWVLSTLDSPSHSIRKVLQNGKRILKPGGKVIVIDGIGGSDYRSIIDKFQPGLGDYSYNYVALLKRDLAKTYKRIVFYKKVSVPYVFPNMKAAYDMMSRDLKYFRGIRLTWQDRKRLLSYLSRFTLGNKVVLKEDVVICSCNN